MALRRAVAPPQTGSLPRLCTGAILAMPRSPRRESALGAPARLVGFRSSLLQRLGCGLDGLRRLLLLGRLVVLRQPLLEALDALGHVTHHRRNLAAAAEQQQRHGQEQQPMPDAQSTHFTLLLKFG